LKIQDEISRCIIQLLVDEPFYAHVLGGVGRKVTDEIDTAAVGLSGTQVVLYINEDFFFNDLKSFSSRVAVIKHEVLHLLFKHLFRYDKNSHDRKLFNVAADLVVNQYVGKWKLPKSALTIGSFPEIDLKYGESLEWYYSKLLHYRKKRLHNQSSDLLEKVLYQDESLKLGDHSKWGVIDTSIQSKLAQYELDKLIHQSKSRTNPKDYSNLPDFIKEKVLRLFVSKSSKTNIKLTNKRISKRFGTRPGTKIIKSQRIAVAVDTSASISNSELKTFFNEIHSIWNNGVIIEIIESDSKVQRTYLYEGITPNYVEGKGSTDFNPVLEYLNQSKQPHDGCIYFTDGEASSPSVRARCRVLWVITKQGQIGDLKSIGRVIKMKN
jgi:predicted metal-dependent peptidase